MPPQNNQELGFVRYEGQLVQGGLIDARSASAALSGFDAALRYFAIQQRPGLAGVDFPIPVRVEPGSWTAYLPHDVLQWIEVAAGLAATTYLTTAAKKLAEYDFGNIGLKGVLTRSVKALQWFARIGKHLGAIPKRLQGLTWNEAGAAGIPNDQGLILYVPRDYFELVVEAPTGLLSGVAEVVEAERRLTIGVNDQSEIVEVTITRREKHIFYSGDEDGAEILFPEFQHGQRISLEGVVTRGNEMTNTIGFQYSGHILTCRPRRGSIVRFKRHLFLQCLIIGEISRLDEHGGTNNPRPHIIFDDLQIKEDDDGQPSLL